MSEVRDSIIQLIIKMYDPGIDPKMFKDSDTFYEYGMDSLDILEFTMRLEKDFSIGFDDDKLEQIKTLGQIVAYVEELIA